MAEQPARPWAEVAADFETVEKLLRDAAAQFPPGLVPRALERGIEALAALRKEWSARGWQKDLVAVSDADLDRIAAWIGTRLGVTVEQQGILRRCAALRLARQERDQARAEREDAKRPRDSVHGCLLLDGGGCPGTAVW